MKTTLKMVALLLPLLTGCLVCFSQDLRKLPKRERNKILIEKAEAAMLEYGVPEYHAYSSYRPPKIESKIMKDGIFQGREIYTVFYEYDKTEMIMDRDFLVEVSILADSGNVAFIYFGVGWGIGIEEMRIKGTNLGGAKKVGFEYVPREEYQKAIDSNLENERRKREFFKKIQMTCVFPSLVSPD